ncbi:MAG: hypothetical protein A2007_01425 [Verrucomicrobia bacterium GWC2_42_7]|nr:MAG: hypothetical protein A2007_01425 [Verrucomicrobia bacterium GWC2_42_7]
MPLFWVNLILFGYIVDHLENRGAFAFHIEMCNDLNLFGDKICKILVAKSLVFLGKVAETLLFQVLR